MLKGRTLARGIVLQTLFEMDNEDLWDKDYSEILERNFDEFEGDKKLISYSKNLIDTVISKRSEIDAVIEKAAPKWSIDRIATIDRNILRIGLAELLYGDHEDVPYKVAINEAIEVAKEFGGENSSKFVNGVLGTVYVDMGSPGKEETSKIDKEESVVAGLAYSKQDDDIYIALVHDIFGFWTLVKGVKKEGETNTEALERKVKEELGLDLIQVEDYLGNTSYVARKDGQRVKRNVDYFIVSVPFEELELKKDGGLDDVRWFRLADIGDLKFYDDILPIISNAVNILLNK